LEKDPNYALGYAGLADAYALLAYYEGGPAAPELLRKAKVAAEKSVLLNDNLAETHTSLAILYGCQPAFGRHFDL
jgi:hypothetical protein